MQITIHQARFGQDEGHGFGLLDTTHPDATRIRSLSFAANIAETPPDDFRWGPALRGGAQDALYMVMRTFLDASPGMRPGRVFSHVLLVDAEQLAMLPDLAGVLNYLPQVLDKSSVLAPITLSADTTAATPALSPRLGKLLNTMLMHGDTQPLVWADESDFANAVCLVWRVLWPALRQQFRFGIGFSVREVKITAPQLLTVPSTLLNPWQAYPIIRPADAYTDFNEVEHYLLGNLSEAPNLAPLLAELDTYPTNLQGLSSIQAVASTFHCLVQASLPKLLALSSVVALLQPSPKHAKPLKQQIGAAIASALACSDLEGLLQVRMFSWQAAFGSAVDQFEQCVAQRFAELLQHTPSLDLTAILARQAADNTQIWWKASVNDGMKRVLTAWRPELAAVVYNLWTNAQAARRLGKILPIDAAIEDDLVASLPTSLSKESAQSGAHLARDKGWLTLHMACALQYLPLATALRQQLALDASAAGGTALRYAQQVVSAPEFVKVAVELSDDKLLDLAGELSATQPALLDLVEVGSKSWQLFWAVSLEHGAIDISVEKRTWALLDYLLDSGAVEGKLLRLLSNSAASNLLTYPRRAEVWSRLPADSRERFLWATASALLAQDSTVTDSELENPLLTILHSSNFAQDYLKRHLTDLSAATSYWSRFAVSESVATEYLKQFKGTTSPIQAHQLGRQILVNHWPKAAVCIFNLAKIKPVFYPALAECLSLLSLLDKLYARVLVHKTQKIEANNEDWWQALLAELCEVYPYGPTQDKIWHHSGGQESWLNTSKSGREQWRALLQRLKRNPIQSSKQFVATVMHENKHNTTFQLLYELLKHDV